MPSTIRLPSSGATTGATPVTVIMRLNARAAARPVTRSAMIARPMTMPAAALTPWTSRATSRIAIVGATAASRLAATNSADPINRGPRLPHLSETGPKTS